MASAWQTMEEAALTLGISSRTLHRRIAKGEVQTRLEHGRREVLVQLPDAPAPSVAAEADAAADVAGHSFASGPEVATAGASTAHFSTDMSDDRNHTMLALHEDRIRRTDLAIMAYQQSLNSAALDARRSRTGSRVAWSAAAAATLTLVLCLTWATHRLTRADADVRYLSDQLNSTAARADAKAREAEQLRQQAEAARVAAARAEGELSAMRGQIDASAQVAAHPAAAEPIKNAPTTRPASPTLNLFSSLHEMLSDR